MLRGEAASGPTCATKYHGKTGRRRNLFLHRSGPGSRAFSLNEGICVEHKWVNGPLFKPFFVCCKTIFLSIYKIYFKIISKFNHILLRLYCNTGACTRVCVPSLSLTYSPLFQHTASLLTSPSLKVMSCARNFILPSIGS